MAIPGQVDVWAGLDVGKGRHNAALICPARRRRDVILAMFRTRHPCQPCQRARGGPRTSLADVA